MKGVNRFFLKGVSRLKPAWIIQTGVILFSMVSLIAVGFLYFFKPDTNISNLDDQLKKSTEIYDMDGKLASKITANKMEGIPIEEVPDYVKEAAVAVEDQRFYKHNGVDYKSIMRAFYQNVKAGGIEEGGSTITQQLIKISLLEPDRTYKRKLEEFFLAREIEKKYSKDEILEMYLNKIYFGHGAWGIKNAARIYFDKEVKELTIAESAMLAGIINVPTALDPYNNPEDSLKRRNLVLKRMKDQKLITENQYTEAVEERVTLNKGKNKGDPLKGKYPYYVDHVLTEASKVYNLDLDELLTGGYKIYTSLDRDMQKAMEDVYKDDSNFPKGTSDKMVQSGAVLVDPKTGGIRALVGGRGEHQFMAYNRATQLKRSPGSTMKPLAVYTPALEEGYKITDELKDEKMAFGGYEPSNINDEYQGEVPMYEAAIKSLNVPTVWLLNEVGLSKSLDTLEKFGIPTVKEDRNLSIALGGMQEGVSPLQMAGAYSAFANKGRRMESHAITKIVDANGKEVSEWKEKETKVISNKITEQMNSMLLGVVKYGTGKNAAVEGWEVAGKTGSTQLPIEGMESGVKDQWFVGYTPTLVGAVWAGYDNTDKKNYLTTHSSEGAALIFKAIMEKALKDQNPESFAVEDIGPLIEQHKRTEKWEQRIEYWKGQQEKLKKNIDKWSNGILEGNTNQKESDDNQPAAEENQPAVNSPSAGSQEENEGSVDTGQEADGKQDQPEDTKEQAKPKPETDPKPEPEEKPTDDNAEENPKDEQNDGTKDQPQDDPNDEQNEPDEPSQPNNPQTGDDGEGDGESGSGTDNPDQPDDGDEG
ncbi:PBP1A family penicillin-binding protein [Peribacillus sp. SCS-155]|uniref:PBP1A family penicillin-binding protein n=1 Tax=Peribacillus sedimenti TaxID=3115297 RepID=UPI003905DFC2